ncbi:hypothetical protein ACFQY5_21800 [Paeniroseomonas aquatica]|uniref:hypothetical protein n=1 Tax=Paeniroseomonas aquatica TaxID=373043 RepID=UPI00361372D1
MELEFIEQVRGGGGGAGGFGVVEAIGHGRVLAVTGRAHRGLRGDHPAGDGTDRHPQAKPEGRSAAEDAGARLSCLARKRPVRAAGKKVARRRCGWPGSGPIAGEKVVGAVMRERLPTDGQQVEHVPLLQRPSNAATK